MGFEAQDIKRKSKEMKQIWHIYNTNKLYREKISFSTTNFFSYSKKITLKKFEKYFPNF
jgi:hypothetical protein